MNVRQLIKKLQALPQDAQVVGLDEDMQVYDVGVDTGNLARVYGLLTYRTNYMEERPRKVNCVGLLFTLK